MTEGGNDTSDKVGASNDNEGDNRNSLSDVEAGGDLHVDQSNKIEQRADGGYGGVISNPNTASGLHDIFAMLSNVQHFESVVVPGSILSGGLGFIGTMVWLLIQLQGFSGDMPSIQAPMYVGIASALLLGFGTTYEKVDSETECPECETRFVFDIDEVDITDVTPLDSRDDVIHADVTRVCRSCEHSETYNDDFTPEEIDRFRSSSY